MLRRQMKYPGLGKRDLQQRLGCVSPHILRAMRKERLQQAMHPRCLYVAEIGGDSWRYDSSP